MRNQSAPPHSLLPAEAHGAADAWKSAGTCRTPAAEGVNFYPSRGEPSQPAKDLCATCPVQAPCLEYSLAGDERFGIWGGLSERSRRRMRSGGGVVKAARVAIVAQDPTAAARSAARRAELAADIETTRAAIGPRRQTGRLAS